MKKIDLPSFYTLGSTLNPLTRIAPAQSGWVNIYLWAAAAKPVLEKLFADYPLEFSRKAGDELMAEIDYWMDIGNAPAPPLPGSPEAVAGFVALPQEHQWKAQALVAKAHTFETVLHAELQQFAAYQVARLGAYSTPELVERAENVFPETIRGHLPDEAVKDVRESGRCLAFDNPTASGFHIMRATESVMHQYYLAVCKKPKDAERLDNWGAYIQALRESKDAQAQEIVAILQQVKDQHRNLIMHPEVFLTHDEAFTLFEISQGAIIAMAGRL